MDPPQDPGGTAPDIGYVVTIQNNNMDCDNPNASVNESSFDTDSSLSLGNSKRKRISAHRICKHCNKKRRKHGSNKKTRDSDCQCRSSVDDKVLVELTQPSSSSSDNKTSRLTRDQEDEVLSVPKHVPTTVARLLYENTDAAPYVVHVQRKQESPNDNITLHPISFGHFLKKNNIHSIVNGSLKRIGRNRLCISFITYHEANLFLTNSKINKDYKVFIPAFSVTRLGVVRGIPAEWSDEEIKENINVPIGTGAILKVRRIKKKITVEGKYEFKPTETVVLTFDGQVLPKRIFVCYTSLLVDLYIYPTIQCFNCCRYGHVKIQCRSKPRCYKCGQEHSGDSCSVTEDDLLCCLCKGFHLATSKSCLEYERQKAIKETMAKSCISYAEAFKLHPPISKISYADALVSTPNVPTNNFSSTQNSTSQSQTLTSYKKTVLLKPRSPPRLTKGYNKDSHNDIIKDYNMPPPANGCALQTPKNSSNNSVIEIIVALINLLSQPNIITPSIAASLSGILSQIPKYSNNGQQQPSQSLTVELS